MKSTRRYLTSLTIDNLFGQQQNRGYWKFFNLLIYLADVSAEVGRFHPNHDLIDNLLKGLEL